MNITVMKESRIYEKFMKIIVNKVDCYLNRKLEIALKFNLHEKLFILQIL